MILDALGLSVGTLRLEFEERLFRPGDFIRGKVLLALTEEVPARRLVVGLDARQRAVGLSPGSSNGVSLSYRHDTVWDFHQDLDGERTYRAGEAFPFRLMVPERALETSFGLPAGTLGDVAQVISFLSPTKRFPLEWRVYAFLDRPWNFNVKSDVPVQLRAGKTVAAKRVAKKARPAKPKRPRPGK